MSQLSLEQQVRGIVIRANFANSEINALVKDVAHLDVSAVVQCAEGLKCDESATPRDAQNASIILGSIERLRRIDEQRKLTERDLRQKALIEQAANVLGRADLK